MLTGCSVESTLFNNVWCAFGFNWIFKLLLSVQYYRFNILHDPDFFFLKRSVRYYKRIITNSVKAKLIMKVVEMLC